MGTIIALAGKGGTGKTTIASLIVRVLKERKAGSILAIDADPNSNFGYLLGAQTTSTIVGIVDDISQNPDQIPPGMTKDRFIDFRIQESLHEEEGFDLLTMGRPEGPGCYCFVNNLLRELIKKLMNNYAYVVVDNEAGMEHLSRRLVRIVDMLCIVSDSSIVGVRSAARISRLVDDLSIEIRERLLILNKSKESHDTLATLAAQEMLELRGCIPLNEELEDQAVQNKSIFALSDRNPALLVVRELLGAYVKK